MSRSSTIVKKLKNGNYRSIYCHNNGQLNYNGRVLFEYYKDFEKVSKLVLLGAVSYIDKEIDIQEGIFHSFDNPINGITVAYHRDRKELFSDVTYEDFKDFKSCIKQEFIYLYLYEDWYVLKDSLYEIENLNFNISIKIDGYEFIPLSSLINYIYN